MRQLQGSKVPYRKEQMLSGRQEHSTLAVKDSWALTLCLCKCCHMETTQLKTHIPFWKKLTELNRAATEFNTHLSRLYRHYSGI